MSAQRSGPSTTFTAGEFETWARTKPEPSQHDRHLAARAIAAEARDVTECQELLNMLGLHAQEGKHDEQ